MSVPALPADPYAAGGRAARLDRCLADLLGQAPELEAAAVVSFDGLAMASALPAGMDEDRVAAMSAALLSLGEKAAQGLGRGDLSQVYVEGENGTVFLVSAQDEAVLVAVAAKRAKVGLMLYEVRRAADAVGTVLQEDEPSAVSAVDTADPMDEVVEPVATAPAPPPVPPLVSAAVANGDASSSGSAVFVPNGSSAPVTAVPASDEVREALEARPPEVVTPPHGIWSPYSPAVVTPAAS